LNFRISPSGEKNASSKEQKDILPPTAKREVYEIERKLKLLSTGH